MANAVVMLYFFELFAMLSFLFYRSSVKLTWKVPPSVTSKFSENQGYSSNQIFWRHSSFG